MSFIKCEKCGINYQPDHGCGMAVLCGKPFVAHCNEPSEQIKNKLEVKSFRIWEAPAGNCPHCWHKENPKKFEGHGI